MRSWRAIRLAVLERDAFVCRYCLDDANHVDHIIPRSRGGLNKPSNLVAACGPCNCSKRDLTSWEWFRREKLPIPPWFTEHLVTYSNDR